MAKFFTDRPVFTWKLILFIILTGAISVTRLPASQYPTAAPPSIVTMATYPGANARTPDELATNIIEREMNDVDGLLYMESVSQDGNDQARITITFKVGADPTLAQVDVQDCLERVEACLPSQVAQQGMQADKVRSNFLLFATLASTDGKMDPMALGDYIPCSVLSEVRRVLGVGQATLFDTERATRVWINPAELVGYKLTSTDVYNVIRAQNALVSAGTIGDPPSVSDQLFTAAVVVEGQLTTIEQSGNIVLVAKPDDSLVRVKDVARLEPSGQIYSTSTRTNGWSISAIGMQLLPTGNALGTAKAVGVKLKELSKYLSTGVEHRVPYDISELVQTSIEKIVRTLLEAVALMLLVMLLFLQNIRYMLVPSIVVPISFLGASATMNAMGFSINILTMFGLVLAIGVLVNDAIMVVENVERIVAEEGLPPRETTRKAMGQITGAIIGITLVPTAMFIPMVFSSDSVGAIYRRFSLSTVSSIFFSVLMALTFTSALCSTLLKPVERGSHHEKEGFFGWFNRVFSTTINCYQSSVERMLRKIFRYMVIYVVPIVAVVFLFLRLPSSFLPAEDQGYTVTSIQLSPDASADRTLEVIRQVEDYYKQEKVVENIVAVQGFGLSGNGPNAGIVFTPFRDWNEYKGKDWTIDAAIGRALDTLFSGIRDAIVFPLDPPPIPELDNAMDFTFRLRDRADLGRGTLTTVCSRLLGMAVQSKVIAGMRLESLEDLSQYQVNINREKASTLGTSFTDINVVLLTTLDSIYTNDFPGYGHRQRVIMQADKINRMQSGDIMNLYVRNAQGDIAPMSTLTKGHRIIGPVQLVCYNGYPAARLSGAVAPGASPGYAMAEMGRLAAKLPAGVGYEWTSQSLQEKASGSQASALHALSLLAVLLVPTALYESRSIPAAVILMVPLGVLGTLLGVTPRAMPGDVYFKVGLTAMVGLSAKSVILIIEFAKDSQTQGKSLIDMALEAVYLRLCSIVMASFVFILDMLSLAITTGASSASQRVIDTGVMGGMITAMVLAVVLVPILFVVVRCILKDSEHQRRLNAAYHLLDEGIQTHGKQ